MKHILVFFAFRNTEDIISSFDSLYLDTVDYFVVENKSENSEEIEKYFLTKKLKGYIQFERNISGNALTKFYNDYYDLLHSYDIITMTDGDVYVVDIRAAFDEIIKNLEYPEAIVSSISLYIANAQMIPTVGLDHFRWAMRKRREEPGPIVTPTISHSLVTLKVRDIHILKSERYQDIYILEEVNRMGGLWIRTNRNLAYHLTWDHYMAQDEYYKWKISVYPGIWEKTEVCPYRKIV